MFFCNKLKNIFSLTITLIVGFAILPNSIFAASISFPQDSYLKDQGFYEQQGTLQVVDTNILQSTPGFFMNKARYSFEAPNVLNSDNPFAVNYQGLSLQIAPSTTKSSSKGSLIKNGKEVTGTDDASLKDKGIMYENVYGQGASMGIIVDPTDIKKIVKIDSLQSLSQFTYDKDFINIPFELTAPQGTTFSSTFDNQSKETTWDQNSKVSVKGVPIRLDYQNSQAYIQPAKAWDSEGNTIDIVLTLQKDTAGNIIFTKQIPTTWLNKATFPVYADATISFGTAVVFNNTSTTSFAVVSLDSTHVVAVYRNSSLVGAAAVGTISGTSISFSAESVFSGVNIPGTLSAAATDSSHIVIGYSDSNTSAATAVVGTISGTSISFGSVEVFDADGLLYISMAHLDSTHVVIAYTDSGNDLSHTAIVGTISGTSISFGTATVFETNSGSATAIAMTRVDSTHVVMVYGNVNNSSFGTAIVGTISGTSISFGSKVVFNSVSTGGPVITAIDSTRVVIAFQSSNIGYGIVGTVSGISISFGTAVLFNNASSSSVFSINSLDSTYVVVSYRNNGNSNYGTSIVGAVAGTSISFDTATVFSSASTPAVFSAAIDSTHVVVAYRNGGNSNKGTAIVGLVASNAAPTFSAITNTSGYIKAGDTVTFTATASDSDGGDTVQLFVCKANDFSAGACGAGGTWASGSAASSNATATYTVVSGDGDGSQTYYANIIDSSSEESVSNPRSSTFTTDVTAPTVSAGSDQTVNAIITTVATASDATSGISSYAWTKQSGSGDVAFGTSTTLNTTISATDGTYTIRLTVTDNAGNSNYDEFTLTWSPATPEGSASATTGRGGAALIHILKTNNTAPILPPTLPSSLKYLFTRYLGYGDRGEDVLKLQQLLQSLGFFPTTVTPNGNYGPITIQSVKQFQLSRSITITGNVGPLTIRALNIFQLTKAILELQAQVAALVGK